MYASTQRQPGLLGLEQAVPPPRYARTPSPALRDEFDDDDDEEYGRVPRTPSRDTFEPGHTAYSPQFPAWERRGGRQEQAGYGAEQQWCPVILEQEPPVSAWERIPRQRNARSVSPRANARADPGVRSRTPNPMEPAPLRINSPPRQKLLQPSEAELRREEAARREKEERAQREREQRYQNPRQRSRYSPPRRQDSGARRTPSVSPPSSRETSPPPSAARHHDAPPQLQWSLPTEPATALDAIAAAFNRSAPLPPLSPTSQSVEQQLSPDAPSPLSSRASSVSSAGLSSPPTPLSVRSTGHRRGPSAGEVNLAKIGAPRTPRTPRRPHVPSMCDYLSLDELEGMWAQQDLFVGGVVAPQKPRSISMEKVLEARSFMPNDLGVHPALRGMMAVQ